MESFVSWPDDSDQQSHFEWGDPSWFRTLSSLLDSDDRRMEITPFDDPYLLWYELDTHPEITSLTRPRRYFTTRIPFRNDENPRGKYPSKPLSWPARKLARVTSWEWEAEQYRKKLWKWQLGRRQNSQLVKESSNVEDDATLGPKQSLIRTTKKKGTQRAQKHRDSNKSKPRFPKPHYLAALDAMYHKQGYQRYWVGCPICNKIAAEWVSETKHKSRQLAFECQGALWDAKNHYAVVDESEIEEEPGFEDAQDDLFNDMDTAIPRDDLCSGRAYRVNFVDRIGRGRRNRRLGKVAVGDLEAPTKQDGVLAVSVLREETEILPHVSEDMPPEGWVCVDELGGPGDWDLADISDDGVDAAIAQKVARARFWLASWFG